MKFRALLRMITITGLMLPLFAAASPTDAGVSKLTIHRRTCGTVTAVLTYDNFSEGNSPFYVAFTVDLNDNGIFGEVGEPTLFNPVNASGGDPIQLGTRLRFAPLPEGSPIAVTAYEVDSDGRTVTAPLEPARYQCTNRPALNSTPSNTGSVAIVGVVARISVNSVEVYAAPSAASPLVGGLGLGQQVNVLGRNSRGDWVQVQLENGIGWFMWQTQARLSGAFANLPVTE